MSYSYDLVNWTFAGHTESGENVSVLVENGKYILFHSPSNGIGIKTSEDLKTWQDRGKVITLGQGKLELGERQNYRWHCAETAGNCAGKIPHVFSWLRAAERIAG